ncbi:hypothetical protein GCM10027456_21670 [Kineosporia babensis]
MDGGPGRLGRTARAHGQGVRAFAGITIKCCQPYKSIGAETGKVQNPGTFLENYSGLTAMPSEGAWVIADLREINGSKKSHE